jgi:hypothetical protein
VKEYIPQVLQPTHPLREIDFFPSAKLWRRYKFLLEDENDAEILWLLDMDKRKRIKGKTCYWIKKVESQDELDPILLEDLQWWIQCMKDAGAWQESNRCTASKTGSGVGPKPTEGRPGTFGKLGSRLDKPARHVM